MTRARRKRRRPPEFPENDASTGRFASRCADAGTGEFEQIGRAVAWGRMNDVAGRRALGGGAVDALGCCAFDPQAFAGANRRSRCAARSRMRSGAGAGAGCDCRHAATMRVRGRVLFLRCDLRDRPHRAVLAVALAHQPQWTSSADNAVAGLSSRAGCRWGWPGRTRRRHKACRWGRADPACGEAHGRCITRSAAQHQGVPGRAISDQEGGQKGHLCGLLMEFS